MTTNTTVLDDKLHWYKDTIIYELHIKAFRDGNGDGIGDFKGLLQKLDYLQELGVSAIWVLPFYPSPLKDDGYDIADYYAINPSYGTLEEFKQFLDEAHKRNLKVITELVINHTSDTHPWFQRARRAPKGSKERNFYVWTDDPNQWKDVRIIFQDFEASNWTWDPEAQQYYWHRFFHHQPDLNYDSPDVQEEIIKIVDFWSEMGVDGFRLDAVPYLFEREGTNGENLPETHEYLKKLRAHMDKKYPGTAFLAEANMWPEDSASYFGDGDECHMNYHFPVMPRMFMALQMEDRYPITDIFDQTPAIPETCQWAMFLRNHDELTLEMVTDEERDYMYKVYAKNPKAKINLGIRHRLAPLMENNRRRIELMNSMLFSFPGTPVIYYGDEIGMGDNFYLGDRNGVRTPMQWSPDRNAGFSEANPHSLFLPIILDPEYHYESVNVEMQRRNTSSLFWFMKRLIAMRKRFKALSRGDMKFINVENPKVLAFTRTYEDETLLILTNLSKFSQAAEVDLSAFKGYQPVEVVSKNKFPPIKEDQPYFFTMGEHSFLWFQLVKVHADTDVQENLPTLETEDWNLFAEKEIVEALENNVLQAFVEKANWFTSKGKDIHQVRVINNVTVPLATYNTTILIVEVTYESGLPELYQLPLTFVPEQNAKQILETCPQAAVASLKVGDQTGLLTDALYAPEFLNYLLRSMAGDEKYSVPSGSLQFKGNEALNEFVNSKPEIRSKIHRNEKSFTSINYDNTFFLKVFRKIDRSINPDVEITRFLSEEVKFANIPAYVGSIELNLGGDQIVLGMMQVMVENHGDGKTFMLDRLNNYVERLLSRDRNVINSLPLLGSLSHPIGVEDLPEELRVVLGSTATDQVQQFGINTAQLHLALASGNNKDFAPEDFSLHYQRSLFSSMQSLVRETYQSKVKFMDKLDEDVKAEVKEILGRKEEVLNKLKRIYSKKLDAIKIRIHGNFHLGQIIFTGKDVAITNFIGDPNKAFSERRLKRSPLRDVAGMVRALHYVAYEGFFLNTHIPREEVNGLLHFAELWSHYMSQFFIKAYLETVKSSGFIPTEEADLKMMLETYMLEKAIYDLNYELNHRPEWAVVPLRVIKSILK